MYTMSSPAAGALHAVLVTVSAQWRPAPDSWLLVGDTGTRGDTGHHTGSWRGTLQWSPGVHRTRISKSGWTSQEPYQGQLLLA